MERQRHQLLASSSRRRRSGVVAVLAALLTAMAAPAAVVHAAAPPITVTVEPFIGGKLVVGKLAPSTPGATGRWVMNYSWMIKNNGSSPLWIDTGSLTVGLVTKTDSFGHYGLAAGSTVRFNAAASFGSTLPAPTSATAKVKVSGYDLVTKTIAVGIHRNPTPRGAYDFPMRYSDLPSNTYWANFETTNALSHHHGDIPQHFAYDILAYRYNGADWVSTISGATAPLANSEFLAWNRPLFAIGAGTIIECRRSKPDLVPGTKDPAHRFGNAVWIRLDSGEIVAYGHMKQNSMPPELCPTQSVSNEDRGTGPIVHAQPVRVYAGQMIGRVGNSGNTSEPHLHIQIMKNAPLDVDDLDSKSAPGLPLTFDSFKTRTRVSLETSSFTWTTIGDGVGQMLPDHGLVYPHPCGFAPPGPGAAEIDVNVSYACFQERVNDVVRAGYAPVAIDGYNVGSSNSFNVVLRSNRPATVYYAGMSASTFQSRITSLATSGYRLLHADSFLVGAATQYAAVWVKQAGPATVAYFGKTAAEHQTQFTSLVAQGYRPAVVSIVAPGGSRRYTAIYRLENVGGFSTSTVKVSDFQATFNTLTGQGLRPTFVDGYTLNGVPYLSYVFTTGASAAYVMKSAMTLSGFTTDLATNIAAGRRTVAWTGYDSGGSARFAAIWR